MSHLIPETLSSKTITRIAIFIALVLTPLMMYSAAVLVNGQMERVGTSSQAYQAKPAIKVSLSRADSDQIAQAIALAYAN